MSPATERIEERTASTSRFPATMVPEPFTWIKSPTRRTVAPIHRSLWSFSCPPAPGVTCTSSELPDVKCRPPIALRLAATTSPVPKSALLALSRPVTCREGTPEIRHGNSRGTHGSAGAPGPPRAR